MYIHLEQEYLLSEFVSSAFTVSNGNVYGTSSTQTGHAVLITRLAASRNKLMFGQETCHRFTGSWTEDAEHSCDNLKSCNINSMLLFQLYHKKIHLNTTRMERI